MYIYTHTIKHVKLSVTESFSNPLTNLPVLEEGACSIAQSFRVPLFF